MSLGFKRLSINYGILRNNTAVTVNQKAPTLYKTRIIENTNYKKKLTAFLGLLIFFYVYGE